MHTAGGDCTRPLQVLSRRHASTTPRIIMPDLALYGIARSARLKHPPMHRAAVSARDRSAGCGCGLLMGFSLAASLPAVFFQCVCMAVKFGWIQ